MNTSISTASIVGFLFLLSGCESTPHKYHWGHYENLIYKSYVAPDEATADIQIEKLNEDIDVAKAKGKHVPPGLYAHLGVIYASQGNNALALAAFNHEKSLFPESVTLIDGMIKRSNIQSK